MVPNGWDIKNLEDLEGSDRPVVKAGPFGSSLKKEFYTETGYKIYGQEQVIADDAFYGDYYIDEERYQSLKSCAVEADDILISLVGTIGKVLLVPDNAQPGVINPRLLRISLNKTQMSSKFFKYFLESRPTVNLLDRWAQGGTMGVLNAATLKALKVPVPPLPEQQKIAKILSTWDKAISTTERLIDNSTQQKKALMQQLLTGKKRLLDDDGKRFESEWKTAPLKDCVTFLNGMRKPIKQEDRADIQGQYPYFGATGIIDYVNDYIFDDELILLGEDGENILSRVVPHVFMVSGKIWVNNHAHVMKANKDKNSEFLCIYLESLDYRKFNSGSAQPKINKAVCEKIPVHFPSLNEQNKIATVLINADQEIELLKQQLADLQQEKKALMQVLLTGKKRVVI